MEIHESGRDGSMLEGVDRENGGRGLGQVQGRGKQKRGLQAEALRWNGDVCAEAKI